LQYNVEGNLKYLGNDTNLFLQYELKVELKRINYEKNISFIFNGSTVFNVRNF